MGLWAPCLINNGVHILKKQRWRTSGTGARRACLTDNTKLMSIRCNRNNKILIWQILFVMKTIVMKTIQHYLLYHCWLGYNLPVLILLFNWFTNTASDTVQSIPSINYLLKTIGPLYLIPFLPRSVATSGKWKQLVLRRSYEDTL